MSDMEVAPHMSYTQTIAFPVRWFARLALAVPAVLLLVLAGSAQAAHPFRSEPPTASRSWPGSTITNTGPTLISGNLGLHPGSAVVGFPPGTVNGARHVGDAAAQQAATDLTTAFNDAAGRPSSAASPPDVGGRTLTGGVYTSGLVGSLGLTGRLTLDAQGDPRAVFVFQIPSTLVTATDSSVRLVNGAQACNVFWQVGSSATLGTRTAFQGNILALTSISVSAGATVNGRLLARNGAVTLIDDTVTAIAVCSRTSPGTAPERPPAPARPRRCRRWTCGCRGPP